MTGRVNRTQRPKPHLGHRQWHAIRYTQLGAYPSRLVLLGTVEAPSLREAYLLAAQSWPKAAYRSVRYPKGRILLCESP